MVFRCRTPWTIFVRGKTPICYDKWCKLCTFFLQEKKMPFFKISSESILTYNQLVEKHFFYPHFFPELFFFVFWLLVQIIRKWIFLFEHSGTPLIWEDENNTCVLGKIWLYYFWRRFWRIAFFFLQKKVQSLHHLS